MPPALTPALAVDYVRELSADVRAVVVLDADGELAAGPEPLAAPARALLDAGGAAELEAVTGRRRRLRGPLGDPRGRRRLRALRARPA